MKPKYRLIDGIEYEGRLLYRIEALRSFDGVNKGDIGGYVEGEHNLSHEGSCWIFDDAMVIDDGLVNCHAKLSGSAVVSEHGLVNASARVGGSVRVSGYAQVFGNAFVCDNVSIGGHAYVLGYANLSGNAVIDENANISGNALVRDYAVIKGHADVRDDAGVYEHSEVKGHAFVGGASRVLGEAVVEGDTQVRDGSTISGSVRLVEGYFGDMSEVSDDFGNGYFIFKNTWSDLKTYTYVVSIDTWFVDGYLGSSEDLVDYGYREDAFTGASYESWVSAVREAVSSV